LGREERRAAFGLLSPPLVSDIASAIMQLATAVGLVALFAPAVLAQTYPACTRELLRTDECAAVVNPSACYNQFRWNTRTLACIDGANDTERKARVSFERDRKQSNGPADCSKACKCCACVGTVMCNWVTQNKYCSS
jgi:hypothetical protein